MASQITLPVWPTTLDCLSWSKDNLIAVAGGDHVAILTPRLKEPGPNGQHWDSILFKANAFTAEEVPLADLLSFQNLSIGEELSLRHVQALDWSPRGIGKFDRCVLAVLSSNHVLSLWECDGNVDVSANWKRIIVVNHTLREHYETQNLGGDTEEERQELQQVSQRVRTFGWIPQSPTSTTSDNGASDTEQDTFLAVSTERGDVVILRVVSPYQILNPEVKYWQVEVAFRFGTDSSIFDIPGKVNGTEDADHTRKAEDKYIVDHMACSPLDDNHQTTIALIARGRLDCVRLAFEGDQKTVEPVLVEDSMRHSAPARADLTGPIRFVPKSRMLLVFAADEVLCVDTGFDPKDKNITFHHLDERWDEVSGVAFSSSASSLPLVHIASLLSSPTAPTTALSLPLKSDEKSSQPSWQGAIAESQRSFSRQYNLDDHVQARVWGIASSPLGDMVATATVLLPSDAPAYITPSDHRTVINITRETPVDGDDILPINDGVAQPSDINSETLLFSLKQALEQRTNDVDPESLMEGLLKAISRPTGSSEFESVLPCPQLGEPLQDARYLKSMLFSHTLMKEERLKLLANAALKKITNSNQISKQVVQRLVPAVLKLPDEYQQAGELSKRIRKVYCVLGSKLQAEGLLAGVEEGDELCRICQSKIPFESVRWAKCTSGHQFSRCGITFLAIQEPNISKHCNICDAQFLNEWVLPVLADTTVDEGGKMQEGSQTTESQAVKNHLEEGRAQMSQGESTAIEQPRSLARVLFAAFDICIYCGGKFTV